MSNQRLGCTHSSSHRLDRLKAVPLALGLVLGGCSASTSEDSSVLTNAIYASPAAADLVVKAITWTRTASGIKFSATIKNEGNAASPGSIVHRVSFRVDGSEATRTWSDTQ